VRMPFRGAACNTRYAAFGQGLVVAGPEVQVAAVQSVIDPAAVRPVGNGRVLC
jgi:hypothetical protein